MKIGIICPSEIAFRRFLPALSKIGGVEFAGVAVCSECEMFPNGVSDREKACKILDAEKTKASKFLEVFGGKLFNSYTEIASSPEIDALYIPLPPSLHYKWAKFALENNKHVLVEKPSTTSSNDSVDLVRIAKQRNLALHENYMFAYHSQILAIQKMVQDGIIGDPRIIRIDFGFPLRSQNDFRYNKSLGGGALIDAGGYVLKLAKILLGESTSIKYAKVNYSNSFDVDMFGSAVLENSDGLVAQVSYGMENEYRCNLDIWGSSGSLFTNRILTAPVGFVPTISITRSGETKIVELEPDDSFEKSIQIFIKSIEDKNVREKEYDELVQQAILVDQFKKMLK